MKIFEIGIISALSVLTIAVSVGAINGPSVEPVEAKPLPEVVEEITRGVGRYPIDSYIETETEAIAETEPVIEYVSLGEFRITAYCACQKCCGVWAENRPIDAYGRPIVYGASGEILTPGYSIAVDPSVIPLGTKVYIDGREYIAHDTGGAIDGNRIDFYMGSHEDALEWGVQYREIFIKKD